MRERVVDPFMPMCAAFSSAGTGPTGGRVDSRMLCATCHILRCRAPTASDEPLTVTILVYDAALVDRMVQLPPP